MFAQVTAKNVGSVFWRHSISVPLILQQLHWYHVRTQLAQFFSRQTRCFDICF